MLQKMLRICKVSSKQKYLSVPCLQNFLSSPYISGLGGVRAQSSTSLTNNHPIKVEFYFDTISPYTWPAFEVLCRYKARWNMDIVWKPVFMGGLVSSAGNPFVDNLAGCPNKAQYMFKDLESRVGEFFEIPLKLKEDPITHIGIIGSLSQQRFVTSVLQNCPEKVEAVCRELWMKSWGPEDSTTHSVEDLQLVAHRAGLSAEETKLCIESMKSPAVKAQLKEVTEEAVDKGAFGSPTMFFSKGSHEEMVWGSDRFDMVANIYGLEWKGPKP